MASRISVLTRAKTALEDISNRVGDVVRRSGVKEGVCHIYIPHTTAGVTINENADPDVGRDILSRLETLVPEKGSYRHLEGNAPGHIKAALVGTCQTVPIEKGRLALGRWQAIFLCEFDGPRDRTVVVQIISSAPAKAGEILDHNGDRP